MIDNGQTVLSHIVSKENVVFASLKEIIQYYQAPVDYSDMKASDYSCVRTTEVYMI